MAQPEDIFPVAAKIPAQTEQGCQGCIAPPKAVLPLTDFSALCFFASGGGGIYSLEPLPPKNGRAGGGLKTI